MRATGQAESGGPAYALWLYINFVELYIMAKDLVFLRHGQAAFSSSASDKILTETGKAQVRTSATRLKQTGFQPEIIIVSPLARALETAKIAENILCCGGNTAEVQVENSLAIQDSDAFMPVLSAALGKHSSVLVVGHVPMLEELPSEICGSTVRMKTGSFASLDVEGVLPGQRQDNSLKENFIPGDTVL